MRRFEKKTLDKKEVDKIAGIVQTIKTAGKIVSGIVLVSRIAIRTLPRLINRKS